jgi:transposase-like protein
VARISFVTEHLLTIGGLCRNACHETLLRTRKCQQLGMHLTQVATTSSMGPQMEDYPETLQRFETRFSTEEGCREYLFQLRWPEGFRCPRCGGGKAWAVGATLFQCSGCDHQTSVTAGTLFHDTRKPLTIWFRAMWYVTSQKNGASALGLQRVLGLGSYRTASSWLHKLRRAMVRPGRDRLTGWVEVDETYMGGLEEGAAGRGVEDKALIVIAAQADGKRIGRIRMRVIHDASADSLHPFIKDSIEPGSTVQTDGWLGYAGLKGYDHEVTKIRKRKQASKLLPRVHLIASLLKRWLSGTHQGAVSHKHLPYYLDEFTFRFNRRKSKSRASCFSAWCNRLRPRVLRPTPTSPSHQNASEADHKL